MWMTVRVVVSALLRRHPPEDALQTCVDQQLRGPANAIVRAHLRRCEDCNRESHENTELLDLLGLPEVDADEVVHLRHDLTVALRAASQSHDMAVENVRKLLGERAARKLEKGQVTPELRREVAAFLGNRAATSLLSRISA
jgi:hypothetical protein